MSNLSLSDPNSLNGQVKSARDPATRLSSFADAIRNLHSKLLFGEIGDADFSPLAEQHFLLAVEILATVEAHLRIASIHQKEK